MTATTAYLIKTALAFVVVLAAALGCLYCAESAFAQEPAKAAAPAKPPAPSVPQQVQKADADMRDVAAGYTRSIAILQKEIDAINAEHARLMQQIQVLGYTLERDKQTGALVYVAKPEPVKAEVPAAAAPKKEQ